MKRIFTFLLCFAILFTLSAPLFAASDTVTLYFRNTVGFNNVYAYAFSSSGENASYPGVEMTHVGVDLYKVDISSTFRSICFNDGLYSTFTTTVPTGDDNVFVYMGNSEEGRWMKNSTIGASGTSTNDGDTSNPTDIGVKGNFIAGKPVADAVISVDVSWESMNNFVYTDGAMGSWNPSDHSYSGGSEGGWSTNKSGITVTNHSNVPVIADFAFNPSTGIKTTGSFYSKSGDTYTVLKTDKQNTVLYSATVGSQQSEAESGTVYFGVSGAKITSGGELGTVTVTVAKDNATYITSFDDLLSAFETGGNFRLACDINEVDSYVSDYDTFVSKTISIDLRGKTLEAILTLNNRNLTIKNGTVNTSGISQNSIYVNENSTLTIEDCSLIGGLNGSSVSAVYESATVILRGNVDLRYSGFSVYGGDPGGTVTILEGTYNFDPTEYVDADSYTVTPNSAADPTSWTVTEKNA